MAKKETCTPLVRIEDYGIIGDTQTVALVGRNGSIDWLMVPLVGFLPPDDARVQGTIAAVERGLLVDGYVLRHLSEEYSHVGGLPPGEGPFLLCSFWLADNHAMCGRMDEARALFERLLKVRNDLGLLAEQVAPRSGGMLGNFPQVSLTWDYQCRTKPLHGRRPRAPAAEGGEVRCEKLKSVSICTSRVVFDANQPEAFMNGFHLARSALECACEAPPWEETSRGE